MDQCSNTTSCQKAAGKCSETRRITYLSLFLACQLDLPARLRVNGDSAPSPATTRSRSTHSRALGYQLQDPTVTENKHKIRTSMEHGEPLCTDLPEWLEEFTDNLVDEEAPASSEAANTSREPLHQEPSIIVVSGKHSIFTHFPNDRTCEVCKTNKITRAPCSKITKFQVKIMNLEIITRMQSWYKIWLLNGCNHIRAKQISGNRKEFAK